MSWLSRTFTCSIGKKQLMAVTGLAFCGFLTVHLIGNLFIYAGKDAFNSYVTHLHTLDPLIRITEAGLVLFAVIHISMALLLFSQNIAARPVTYIMKQNQGGRTPASSTMPYTGLLILIFLVFHLTTFKTADHTNQTVFDIVKITLEHPVSMVCYIFMAIVVAFHVNHGFWSAFQTIGINHPKYTPAIKDLSVLLSVIIGCGFGFIPIFIIMT